MLIYTGFFIRLYQTGKDSLHFRAYDISYGLRHTTSLAINLNTMKIALILLVALSCVSAEASTLKEISPKETSEVVTIAVSSNFLSTMKRIVVAYERETGKSVVVSSGSTGKHFAQLSHGAPYDVFFAADALRPRLLEEKGLGINGSRFTYAFGRLVIWSAKAITNNHDPKKQSSPAEESATESDIRALFANTSVGNLKRGSVITISLANPKLAPYGKAAQQVIENLSLEQEGKYRRIQGENIGQAYQFVLSGASDMGFLAYSQVLTGKNAAVNNHYLLVPEHLHSPINQQAIQFTDNKATDDFVAFIKGDVAKGFIRNSGYRVEGFMQSTNIEKQNIEEMNIEQKNKASTTNVR